MKISRRCVLAGGAFGALAVAAGRAHADPLLDRLTAIAGARASMKTLSGPFTQERTIGLLATKIRSTGRLTLVRPVRLRWDVTEEQVTFWIAPEGLAYRGPQSHGRLPATQKLSRDLDELRAWLSGDPRTLRDRYELLEVAGEGGGVTLEARPKTASAHFAKVVLALDADLVRPRRVTLVESPRDRTDIVFGELAKDAGVDPAAMRLPD